MLAGLLMHTTLLRVDPITPDPALLERAAEVLRAGGLVAFPTETVYGLGANALDPEAVAGIFTAKGRPANNPVIVHVVEVEAIRTIAAAWPDTAARLAARFWPGPLTLVLPKRDVVPAIVTAGGPTVAVRIPAHPVAQALIRIAGVPLAAPSANCSSMLSPTLAGHVLNGLGGRIHMILDAGPCAGGLESTVLDVTTSPPRLLRPGLVTPAEIEAVIGPIQRPTVWAPEDDQPLPSPGLMQRHYAPRAPLECVEEGDHSRMISLREQGVCVGWLTFTDDEELSGPGVTIVRMPRDPPAYAAQLYAVLHTLDDRVLVDRIVVTFPPDSEEWLAVRDRLRRASTQSKKE